MKIFTKICFAVLICFSIQTFAQIPIGVSVQISKAEDELRFDKTLETLLKNRDAKIRARAALAVGRIGKETAIPILAQLLENDSDTNVRAKAAFALGEIESAKAADAILKVLRDTKNADSVRARAVEVAGKIAAANAKDEKAKNLNEAILDALQFEENRGARQNREIVLLGITAILRAKPENGDSIAGSFLTSADARIRADAANTLSRLRSKTADEKLRAMLLSDSDPIARSNAARALGAAEDKDAFNLLLEAAVSDEDSRVRVSAIRSLGSLKDAKAADRLLTRGENLLTDYKKSKFSNPSEKNELLEIATTLGRILPNMNSEKAIEFLQDFREFDKFRSPETEIAFAQISPKIYLNSEPFAELRPNTVIAYAQSISGFAQALREIAGNKVVSDDVELQSAIKQKAEFLNKTTRFAAAFLHSNSQTLSKSSSESFGTFKNAGEVQAKINEIVNAFADVLRTSAKISLKETEYETASLLSWTLFSISGSVSGKRSLIISDEPKSRELQAIVDETNESKHRVLADDTIVRATAAEILGENNELDSAPILAAGFDFAQTKDKESNDAQLAILDAVVKQNKESAKKVLVKALNAPDFLVRRRAAQLIKQNDLQSDFPNADEKVGTVKPYNPKTKTKLGVILNTNADYIRAISRKSARAILTTEKGSFTIEFFPEAAPLTVDNFIKLARKNYFNGLAIHRVVPNFVMQDGDPRGDGNGGPGWEIRDEINEIPFERGTVGMALSGRDTGGSQWFVCHSPQPHLDGGYTVFGKVSETDMKVVDNLVRGDRILTVKIVEGKSK